jgi:hypothetical protein
MDFLGDDEAALAIIKTWGWGADARCQEYVPLTVPLNETINRLAMEGHSDPAGALLSLLCCQTAFKRDPRSASKRDPLFG